MARQSYDDNRRLFAQTVKDVVLRWRSTLQDDEFYSMEYLGLFTEIWLMRGEAVYKTHCYRFVPRVGPQTAKKYVQKAIANGYLLESDNPHDRRSKLITMSPDLKALLDRNFDQTARELRKALKHRWPSGT